MLRTIVSLGSCDVQEIIECEDGDNAMKVYPQLQPDVVLMDIQLKTMNGFTVTEQIYQQDPSAKIVFVTSHDTPAHRTKAHVLHAKGFISKENLSELDSLIHSLS